MREPAEGGTSICRDLRTSRKVVRQVIRSQATEFHYQRDVQPEASTPKEPPALMMWTAPPRGHLSAERWSLERHEEGGRKQHGHSPSNITAATRARAARLNRDRRRAYAPTLRRVSY